MILLVLGVNCFICIFWHVGHAMVVASPSSLFVALFSNQPARIGDPLAEQSRASWVQLQTGDPPHSPAAETGLLCSNYLRTLYPRISSR